MGNTQSNHQQRRAPSEGNGTKRDGGVPEVVLMRKGASGGLNEVRHQRYSGSFRLISPSSDISNPSNVFFRKLQTPSLERRRSSKVMDRNTSVQNAQQLQQRPPQFYIDNDTSPPSRRNCRRASGRRRRRRPYSMKNLRRKANRAKKAFGQCFGEQTEKLQACMFEKQQHQQLLSPLELNEQEVSRRPFHNEESSGTKLKRISEESAGNPILSSKHVDYAQFDVTRAPPMSSIECSYLHSAEDFFNNISSKDDSHSPTLNTSQQHQAPQSSRILDVSILEEEEEDFARQPKHHQSPVATLFDKTVSGVPSDLPVPAKKDKTVAWLDYVLEIQSQGRQAAKPCSDSESSSSLRITKTQSTDSNETGPLGTVKASADQAVINLHNKDSARKRSIESDVQRQIDEQLKAKKSLPDSLNGERAPDNRGRSRSRSLQNLEHPSQRRQSVSREKSKVAYRGRSTQPRPQDPEERRRSGIRIERLAKRYEHELIKLSSAPTNKFRRNSSILYCSDDTESIVQRNRRLFETKRSSSVPPTPTRDPLTKVPKRNRSRSQPRTSQPSQSQADLPVLLKMAGWKSKGSLAKTEKPLKSVPNQRGNAENPEGLPILLQLAGWSTKNDPKTNPLNVGERRQSATARLQGAKTSAEVKKTREIVSRRAYASLPMTEREMASANQNVRAVETAPGDQENDIPSKKTVVLQQDQPKKVDSSKESKGITTAWMLQQTFQINDDYGHKTNKDGDLVKSAYGSMVPKGFYSMSPAISVGSRTTVADSPDSIALVSEQATSNAAFLFADPIHSVHDHSESTRSSTYTLNTRESRQRVPTRTEGIVISQRSSYITEISSIDAPPSIDQVSSPRLSDERKDVSRLQLQEGPFRGRKVGINAPTGTVTFATEIEHKMSDLTETILFADKREKRPSSNLTATSECLQEEQLDEEIEEQADQSENNLDENSDAATTIVAERQRWSYRQGSDPNDNGVTPFRKGGSSSLVTNSPFLRFKEARNKFSIKLEENVKPTVVKRHSPVKRSLGCGAVFSRVAQMESHLGGPQETVTQTSKIRRATTGHKVLAPSRGVLVSPIFKKQDDITSSHERYHDSASAEETSRSPTLIDGHVVDSPRGTMENPSSLYLSAHNFDDKVRPHQSPSTSSPVHVEEFSDSDDDDAFADILNSSDSEDVGENDDDTRTGDTVSTVRQEVRSPSVVKYASYRSSVGSSRVSVSNSSTVSSIQQNRLSFADDSTCRSSVTDQWPPDKRAVLPFREEAPVRPNEQSHRFQSGGPLLSPMQGTPMQARKWRALALAAQENKNKHRDNVKRSNSSRHRSSLSERHPNIPY